MDEHDAVLTEVAELHRDLLTRIHELESDLEAEKAPWIIHGSGYTEPLHELKQRRQRLATLFGCDYLPEWRVEEAQWDHALEKEAGFPGLAAGYSGEV